MEKKAKKKKNQAGEGDRKKLCQEEVKKKIPAE